MTGTTRITCPHSSLPDNGKYEAIEWVVVKDGQEVSRQKFAMAQWCESNVGHYGCACRC